MGDDVLRQAHRSRNYTREEDELLIKYYGTMPLDELKKMFQDRSAGSLSNRAIRIKACNQHHFWTQEEKDILRDSYATTRVEDIELILPNRSHNAIVLMAEKLGLHNIFNRPFTEEDNEYIRENFRDLSNSQMAEHLNRSVGVLKGQMRSLGCKRDTSDITKYSCLNKYMRRHNEVWRRKSIKKWNGRCVISQEPSTVVHHLINFGTIIARACFEHGIDPDIDINTCPQDVRDTIVSAILCEQDKYPMGVCITKDLHALFHKRYGLYNNTIEQFHEFARSVNPSLDLVI